MPQTTIDLGEALGIESVPLFKPGTNQEREFREQWEEEMTPILKELATKRALSVQQSWFTIVD